MSEEFLERYWIESTMVLMVLFILLLLAIGYIVITLSARKWRK